MSKKKDDPLAPDNSAFEDGQQLLALWKECVRRHGENWARHMLKKLRLPKGRRKKPGQNPLLVAYRVLGNLTGVKPSVAAAVKFAVQLRNIGWFEGQFPTGSQKTLERRLWEQLKQ